MSEKVDLNGDTQKGNTLLYIPTEAELQKMNFVDTKVNGKVTITAEEHRQAFGNWIANNRYTKNNRGKYSKRNQATAPWENRFDVHFAQSFYYLKERGSKVELTVDILNFANMLNHDWGTNYALAYNETILKVEKLPNNNGKYTPSYTCLGYSPNKNDIYSRWQMQVGLRVTF